MSSKRGKRLQFYLMPIGSLLQVIVPRWLVLHIAALVIRGLFPFLKTQRRVAAENLRYILGRDLNPGEGDLFARQVLFNLAVNSADLMRAQLLSRGQRLSRLMTCVSTYELSRILTDGRPAILVTGHIGNWDLAGVYLARMGFPIAAVFERIPRGMSDVFNRFRGTSGMELIGLDDRTAMNRALQTGKLFVLVGDRDLRGNGLELPWFGGRRTFPRGAAAFALRYKVPIVIGYFVFEPGDRHKRYRAIVEPPLEFTPSGNVGNDVEALTALVVKGLERVVASYPDQWLVLQPKWLGSARAGDTKASVGEAAVAGISNRE